MTTPSSEYRRRIAVGELEADPAQDLVVTELDRLHADLIKAKHQRNSWLHKLPFLSDKTTEPVRGIYVWGHVGRGKTLLMDLFHDCLPFEAKTRQHFHRFMASVHDNLKQLKDRSDPLEIVADMLAARTRVICFDEFAVTDIADAMILGNLFSALFRRGVTLAATSNIEPDQLYRGGLQRQRFLPAINAIKKHAEVLYMDGIQDYRLRVLERADVYQFPADDLAERHLTECFEAIAPDRAHMDESIEILGRPIGHRRCADGVVWFDFGDLCDGPRSQDDYIELSRLYQTILVSSIPILDATLENQARRFVAAVDEFYDRRVKLIVSAHARLNELYQGTRLTHEFKRTLSRLQEMQSLEYLASAHRP